MKIAFVSPNQERLPDAVLPIGLLCVMANTPAHHETVLWDLCFEDDPLDTLAGRLREFQPDVVAVGMRNIQSNDYTGCTDNVAYHGEVIRTIRRHSTATVVLGGAGFSVMPTALMRRLAPDFGIAGEGEGAFGRLLDGIEAGGAGLHEVPSLHYFRGRQVVANPPGAVLALDALERPDRSLADDRYYTAFGVDSVQTKRGCPLRCTYCTYPLIEGRSIRERDPARVVDELLALGERDPAPRHVFIVDSVFNLPPRHAKEVCREMIRRGFDTPWTCYANPIGFDRELAELLKASGCAGLEIGSDSGCDESLRALQKGFDTAQIRRMHELCAAVELPDCHTFIVGTEGETLAHVRRTLDFCRELDPFAVIIMVWTDDGEAVDPALARERGRLREAILALLREKEDEFPRWIIPNLGTNFDARLFSLLRRRGLHGPLWQHLTLVGSDARSRRLKRSIQSLPPVHPSSLS